VQEDHCSFLENLRPCVHVGTNNRCIARPAGRQVRTCSWRDRISLRRCFEPDDCIVMASIGKKVQLLTLLCRFLDMSMLRTLEDDRFVAEAKPLSPSTAPLISLREVCRYVRFLNAEKPVQDVPFADHRASGREQPDGCCQQGISTERHNDNSCVTGTLQQRCWTAGYIVWLGITSFWHQQRMLYSMRSVQSAATARGPRRRSQANQRPLR